jgi:hypothetical protein
LFLFQGFSEEQALAYSLLFFVTVWLIPGLTGAALWQIDPPDLAHLQKPDSQLSEA